MTFIELYEKYITRPGSKELLEWLKGSDFFTAPASTKFHGDHEGGLQEHSVNVWLHMVRLLKSYPEIKTNGETVAIVTLLHDLCKVGCYKTEMRNVKVGNVWTQKPYYTFDEDFPFGGHGSKSVFLINQYMKLTNEEAVAINCHMGHADRSPGDYSLAPAYEKYPLAWVLHCADEAAAYLSESKTGGIHEHHHGSPSPV